jgi:hypothetical protein
VSVVDDSIHATFIGSAMFGSAPRLESGTRWINFSFRILRCHASGLPRGDEGWPSVCRSV